MDFYSQAEEAALKVAHGDPMEVETMSLDWGKTLQRSPWKREGTSQLYPTIGFPCFTWFSFVFTFIYIYIPDTYIYIHTHDVLMCNPQIIAMVINSM